MTSTLLRLFICILIFGGSANAATPIGVIKIFTFSSDTQPFVDKLMEGSNLEISYQSGGGEQLAKTWFHSQENARMDLLLIHAHFVKSRLWKALGSDSKLKLSDYIETLNIPELNTTTIDILHDDVAPSDKVTLPWIMANTIPMFSSELPSDLVPKSGQSAKEVLTKLAAAGYQMLENNLPDGGTISDMTKQIRALVPELKIIDTGSAGMGAVHEVAKRTADGQKVFTFFGLHPYAQSGAGVEGIHLYNIDDELFQAPVVPLVRRDLTLDRKKAVIDLLSYLASEEVQKRAASFRFSRSKQTEGVAAWVSGRMKSLCSKFKITENVPLFFGFELKENGKLLCKGGPRGRDAEGEISCEPSITKSGGLDCFAEAQNGSRFLAVQLNPESTDSKSMGKIVSGFSAGGNNGFFIGRGGWTLGCTP